MGQVPWPASRHPCNKSLGFQCISFGDSFAAKSHRKSCRNQSLGGLLGMGSGPREVSCDSVNNLGRENFQAEAARLSDSTVPNTVPGPLSPFAYYWHKFRAR